LYLDKPESEDLLVKRMLGEKNDDFISKLKKIQENFLDRINKLKK
jgi:hypothetical protein